MVTLLEYANSVLPRKRLSELFPGDLAFDISEDIVAKRILKRYFKKPFKKMPRSNKGFDYLINNNIKIDIKSSILKNSKWGFQNPYIRHICDYYLCIGYDNKKDQKINILYLDLIGTLDLPIGNVYRWIDEVPGEFSKLIV